MALNTYEVKFVCKGLGYNGGDITKIERVLTHSEESATAFVQNLYKGYAKKLIHSRIES